MTLWFCDRCGKQVSKDSYGAGKYAIQKTFWEEDEYCNATRVQRFMKFCDNCSDELEKILDDEFAHMPSELVGKKNREG